MGQLLNEHANLPNSLALDIFFADLVLHTHASHFGNKYVSTFSLGIIAKPYHSAFLPSISCQVQKGVLQIVHGIPSESGL